MMWFAYLQIEEDPYTIDIKITEPHKVGDGMSAYVVYKIITKVRELFFLIHFENENVDYK